MYRFAVANENHADLASGAVLHSAPGYPAFPVRLAEEVFARAWQSRARDTAATLWDPCCGSGYLVSVIALRQREKLRAAVASDADPAAVKLAAENLRLLTRSGLASRAATLRKRATDFGKSSYRDAADAADRIAARLHIGGGDLETRCGTADAFAPQDVDDVVGPWRPDIAITDVPYGEQTRWWGERGDPASLVRAIAPVLAPGGIIAVTVRGRKVALRDLPTVGRFKVGTRAIALVAADELASGDV